MSRSAIASWSFASALALAAAPASAQKVVTEDEVGPVDVAMTPVEDLNLRRDPIPPILLQAWAEPYANPGLDRCDELRDEIGNLDAVLGEDFDSAPPRRRNLDAGKIAQRVLASFIPYRGLIRELSGAEKHEFEFRQAISAGLMRRAYLKGLGEAMGCPYPARPMPPETLAALTAPGQAPPAARTAADETLFYSEPVVQRVRR